MIGKQISPILEEIEGTIIDFDVYDGTNPCYTREGFRAASKIFMSALMDKMWDLQEAEQMPMPDRCNMATEAGKALRQLVITYTGIDSHDLYR